MIRLYATLENYAGITYDIEIHDTEWVGASVEYVAEAPGFELNYTPSDDTRTPPLITSACEVYMLVDSDQTDVIAFLDDLIAAPEFRFQVVIYRDTELFWVGNVLTDQNERQDDFYPLSITLAATDSIATLKKIEYDIGSPGAQLTVMDLIEDVITRIGLIPLYTGGDPLLKVIYNWWAQEHTYAVAVNPLDKTRIRNNTFIEVDRRGVEKVLDWFSVLERTAQEFGFTFFYSAGTYWITQANEYNGASWVIHTYDTAFAKLSGFLDSIPTKSLYSPGGDVVRILGALERYYPPLREVVVRYNYFSGANLIFDLATIKESAGGVTIPDVNSNSGVASFLFSGNVAVDITQWRIDNVVPNDIVIAVYRVKISIADGGSGWSFQGGETFVDGARIRSQERWVNDPNQYFYVTVSIATSNYGYRPFRLPDTTNPMIPADGDMTVSIGLYQLWRMNPATGVWISSVSSLPDFSVLDPYFEVFYNGIPRDNYDILEYRAQNDSDANTDVIEIDTYHGDGPTATTLGKIQVITVDTPETWADSTSWRVGNSGSYVKFSQLLADEIMRGQVDPVPRMFASQFGTYDVYERLNRSGRSYIFRSGKYSAASDSWDGVWFQIGLNPVPVTPTPKYTGTSTPIANKTPNFPSSTTDASPTKFPDPILLPKLSPVTIVGFTDAGTVITEINVTEITQAGIYNEGDIITVVTPEGLQQTFVITQDAAVGDTVLHVSSSATDFDFYSGVYVLPADILGSNGQFAGIYAYLDFADAPETIAVTSGVWATVALTQTIAYAIRFSASGGGGVAVYDGTVTQIFFAVVSVSFGVSNNNSIVAFAVARNGVRNAGSVIYAERIQSAESNQLVVLWLDSLITGDEVSLEVLADYTGTVDIEGFTVILLPASSGGLLQPVTDDITPPIRYKQVFPTVTGTTVTVTVNGGVLPADLSKIDVLRNGVEMSPSYWTISGSDVIYTGSYPYDAEEITVKFFYP